MAPRKTSTKTKVPPQVENVAEKPRPKADPFAPLERLAANTMTGDIRDIIVNTVKFHKDGRPYDSWSQVDQEKFLAQVNQIAEDTAKKAVRIAVEGVFPSAIGTLKGMTVKDGFKLNIEVPKTEEKAGVDLLHAQGGQVVVVICRHDQFFGQRDKLEAAKDQPDLIPPPEQEAPKPALDEAPVFQDLPTAAEPENDAAPEAEAGGEAEPEAEAPKAEGETAASSLNW